MKGHPLARLVVVLGALIATVVALGPVPAQAQAPSSILRAFQADGAAIPACEFTEAQLAAGLRELPPDLLQYGVGLVDAIHEALLARASGACDSARQSSSLRASTPAPHGPSFPSSLGPVAAATGANLPLTFVLLAVLALAAMLAGAVLGLARFRGWDPPWAAHLNHSWREAGYRTAGAWAALIDRMPSAGVRAARAEPGAQTGGSAKSMSRPAEPSAPLAEPSVGSPDPKQAGTTPVPARLRTALALALIAIGATVAVVMLSSGSSGPPAGQRQEAVFQDDDHLLYSDTATVTRVLGVLRGLGVNRVRITVKWSQIAPAAATRTRPRFDATDPAAYPAAGWVGYDRVLRLSQSRGIAVDFDITAPGPLWAMRPAPAARAADHYFPSSRELGLFVVALGRRYSGSYTPTAQDQSVARAIAGLPDSGKLPRVTRWSIWNEPNQPGWLAPQWSPSAGVSTPTSPRLYREYVNEAFAALDATGHSVATDSILIGSLAPGGRHAPGAYTPMTPLQFVRALYCVDGAWHPLSGPAAVTLGCPARVDRHSFVNNNLGLFEASGFGHHPYDLFDDPSYQPPDPDVVTLATISRLSAGLDRIFATYGVARKIPLYVTEYGYQTNPPDPYQVVSPAQQAIYLNQAAYMAWRNPRIRSFAQFLLYDANPDPKYPRTSFKYWATFQTGLLFANGKRKPAFSAYRLPIWLPAPRPDRSGHVLVWGQLRFPHSSGAGRVQVQWRALGSAYRSIASTEVADGDGFFTVSVRSPGAGLLRLAWHDATGRGLYSRGAAVSGP